MKSSDKKIAAVVVTYNRLQLLKECIESLRNQSRRPNLIIVINNSSNDGTADWLYAQHDLLVVTQDNAGNAGGQYTGINLACDKGYEWVWCMDDDAEPYPDALEKLLEHMNISLRVSALAGQVIGPQGNILIRHRGNFHFARISKFYLQTPIAYEEYQTGDMISIDFASFVGILINTTVVKEIGLPKREFFIQHDDEEYCLRLGQVGGLFLVPHSKIIHKENMKPVHSIEKRFLWKKSNRIPIGLEWTQYFAKRNHVWLCRKYVSSIFVCYASIISSFLVYLRRILLYDDYKVRRIYMLVKAYEDGFRNIFDNNKPRMLNKIE